ncbi:hypothetical protein B566_EDAN004552 [Ephemera danica]|nr:hypothetical protein B566_EDAN004552 [Ephemera danica]
MGGGTGLGAEGIKAASRWLRVHNLNMKTILLVSLWCCVLLYVRADKSKSAALSRFDNIDIDSILRSNRLIQNYINWMLPTALSSECEECNESQRKKAEKVLRFIIDNKYPQFLQIEAKYDPTQSYRKKYPEFFAKKQ